MQYLVFHAAKLIYVFRFFYFDFIFENTLTHEALHTEIRKPVMNRNTHGEERRQVEKATRSERIAWIESLVGQLRSLVSCVCWSNCGTLEKIRFTEVECERFFITKTQ
ncbi:hypothetical protein T4D_13218 [Trichinella pseudospiralis]|uniref:Uncharacterized protein n=1 Tax=Trichinella pseudospiralis TaxID=6337 RepID=A0A0V1F4H1_TRIPS|nr:hypothetical protein T4D_13944 [Trichinella pseudospiralis]KRY81065.1 hypothetical protein T4D_13218 [Trichinella pseudospiralis]